MMKVSIDWVEPMINTYASHILNSDSMPMDLFKKAGKVKIDTQKREKFGAILMKVSTLVVVFILLGCFEPSSGEPRNRCGDDPPAFDSKKITPGMYIRAGSDTSSVAVIHSNGVNYVRVRQREDNTTGPGRIASESWVYWLDSATQFKGVGFGEERMNTYFGGGWSNEWQQYVGMSPKYKKNVTATSYELGGITQIRDDEGRLVDCVWTFYTSTKIGEENDPWPIKVNWSEVWPDSVRRN